LLLLRVPAARARGVKMSVMRRVTQLGFPFPQPPPRPNTGNHDSACAAKRSVTLTAWRFELHQPVMTEHDAARTSSRYQQNSHTLHATAWDTLDKLVRQGTTA